MGISDEELVNRAHRGDLEAIGTLFDRHQPHIHRYVWVRVSHDQLAEDLTGEIFARMVKNLPAYRLSGTPFRAWLYRMAHNLIVDHYRKQNGRGTLPLHVAEEISEPMSDPDHIVSQKLTLERVEQALDKIEPLQREVVVLRFLVGLSLGEVAETLDRSVGAIKSIQHRGLSALRIAMEQEVYT